MTSDSLAELAERIRHLARVPVLLVACDYDGTVAPLVDDPMAAHPNRETVAAMRTLAESAQTHVAVISGRSLRDLATLSRLPAEVRLVGSHGSEFDLGFASQLPRELAQRRRAVTDAVLEVAGRYGAAAEDKPTGVTFHFRGLAPEVAAAARDELVRGPASRPDIFVRNGHDILELSVIETNKGRALEAIRHQVSASAVLFLGDDVTDEDAFATLTGPDVGIKVGRGHTVARYRVADTSVVPQVLALLCELRTEWLRGAGLVPIEDHSILSDLRTAAIVTPSGRISWLCVPRIDSGAVFAELVGGPAAGYYAVSPAGGGPVIAQRYRPRSMVLETRFAELTVTDYLDVSGGRPKRLAGRSDLVRVLSGRGRARIEFAPRLDFGRVPTRLEVRPDGVAVLGTPDLMVLRAPGVSWHLEPDGNHETAVGTVELGDTDVVLELRAGTGTLRADARAEIDRRDDTERWWSGWASKLELPSLERDLVERSALVLKSLCHGPTGAIVAAATTSLPEHLGGVRNWDYRYCWLRDAALTAATLVRLGSHEEAMDLLDWVLRVLESRGDPERLAPLYNVTGRHLAPEAEIAELAGYGGSRPVRVGNAAEGQVQLDVFGPIVELVHLLLMRGEALSAEHWRLVEAMVLAVSRRWTEPDHGIWEIRKPPRHHVHSKVMCWLTVDRAIAIAQGFLDREPSAWVELRDQIADEVMAKGWNAQRGAFTAAYDGDDLDAAALAVGLSGLLAPDDERFRSTVAAVEGELRSGPTVHRYHGDDGLPGREGGFNLMTSWLIDALVLVGRRDDARALFDELCTMAGATGLMAEELDPVSRRALGNVPQAYSHLGLINNALALDA
jgi:trehalose-phosphatase